MISSSVKKIISYFLVILVVFFTIVALLNIWEIINLEFVMRKIFMSLLAIFGAVAVVLFIFSVLITDSTRSDSDKPKEK